MTKGRTTTYDERVEIVRFCIEHQHNYVLQTADVPCGILSASVFMDNNT
ncbi:hypothetical protein P7H12_16605 [Paenibacillus larvae]|nr:hypothetical protein [Paenibacillus larvae]MDT2264892.1 hypothetical protein [Paenibacillus larvae]